MSKPAPDLPDRAAELVLHQRLLEGDPTASDDLATTYFEHLVSWLEGRNERRNEGLCVDAAGEAIVSLMKNPSSYKPERGTLIVYLRMSAQRDLQNLLAGENRHHRNRIPMTNVEHSDEFGKYLGREDDPSLPLRLQEEQRANESIPESVRDTLDPKEERVLRLMQRGIRDHAEFAVAYEVTHLPLKEQKKEVKRVKDRLKIRLKRAEGDT